MYDSNDDENLATFDLDFDADDWCEEATFDLDDSAKEHHHRASVIRINNSAEHTAAPETSGGVDQEADASGAAKRARESPGERQGKPLEKILKPSNSPPPPLPVLAAGGASAPVASGRGVKLQIQKPLRDHSLRKDYEQAAKKQRFDKIQILKNKFTKNKLAP